MGDGFADLVLGELVPVLAAHPLVDARLVGQRVAVARRQSHLLGGVLADEDVGNVERVVRTARADVQAPRLRGLRELLERPEAARDHAPVVALVVAEGAVGRQRAVQGVVTPAGTADQAAPAGAGRVGVWRELAPAVERGLHHGVPARRGLQFLPAAVRRVLLGGDVPLTGVEHPVPGLAQALGPHAQTGAHAGADGGGGGDVVVDAVDAGVDAGHQRGTRRAAVRRGAVGLGERDALARQPVGVRRPARVIRPQDVGLLLVRHEDEHVGWAAVGPCHLAFGSPCLVRRAACMAPEHSRQRLSARRRAGRPGRPDRSPAAGR